MIELYTPNRMKRGEYKKLSSEQKRERDRFLSKRNYYKRKEEYNSLSEKEQLALLDKKRQEIQKDLWMRDGICRC